MASPTTVAPTARLALPRRLGGGAITLLGALALPGLLPAVVAGPTALRMPPGLGRTLALFGMRVVMRLRALMVTPTMTRGTLCATLLVMRRLWDGVARIHLPATVALSLGPLGGPVTFAARLGCAVRALLAARVSLASTMVTPRPALHEDVRLVERLLGNHAVRTIKLGKGHLHLG